MIIGNTYLNLIDVMKRDGTGDPEIVEALHTLNPVMRDANVITCNLGTKHLVNIRTGLPEVSWGAIYEGIAQGKSTTTQVEDVTGFLEGLSTVDTRLLKIAKDPAKVRLSEAEPYFESMGQEFEETFFYSDVRVSPRKFHGIAPRYNTLNNPNVVNGGGAGSDNTSIWFVTWGDNATSIITPDGTSAGIVREDKGEQRATDAQGNPYFVKEEMFTQHAGCSVKDWRRNSRVANLDVSEVIAGTKAVNPLMRSAYYKLHGARKYTTNYENGGEIIGATRTVIYMNKTILEALDAEGSNAGSDDNFIRLTPKEIQGEEVMTWRGIPIRESDNILNTEGLVPAS
ncbi:major capsid protein [Sphingopyxis macrogoltabida]|uniref:Major capsid protein n=1 Tax=Sphingopyxis macrogoltabida TaxID=33050 RepID=A0A0N9USH9_SPHMC|nr:hypothetical protein [Sphingopyxis macrogoltabida]ALH82910.1 hypothetical protein AN936_21895 [Sphingopyxis macrogoltabida]